MLKSAGITVLLAAALLLGGCVSVGQIATRGTSIDQGVGDLQNRSILLNLARASHGEPLYFVSVSPVSSYGTTDLRLGAPGFIEGPNLSNANKAITLTSGSAYLDNTINTNLTLNVYATKDFYAGLMAPVGLDGIDLLLHQGYPREMVYYLLIDKAKITPVGPAGNAIATPYFVYNDPTNTATYKDFVSAIEAAMEHGLMTEPMPPTHQPPSAQAQAASDQQAQTNLTAPPQRIALSGSGAKGADIQFVLKPADDPRAGIQNCYEQALVRPDKMADFSAVAALTGAKPNFCGSGQRASSAYLLLGGKLVKIEVSFRSIYGVFSYLGGIVAHPEATPVLVDYGIPSETTPAGPLLSVTDDEMGCFAAVRYAGRHYCVPQNASNDNSERVFSILTALVALKQSPGDLPVSQSLLLAQ